MLDSHSIDNSRARWKRVGSVAQISGLVVLFCGLCAALSCGAQTVDQAGNQSQNQQTGQSQSQDMDQQPYPPSDQQQGQYQQSGQGQGQNQESGQGQGQQPWQGRYQQQIRPLTPYQQHMQDEQEKVALLPSQLTADQIISMLVQYPDVLEYVKYRILQQKQMTYATVMEETGQGDGQSQSSQTNQTPQTAQPKLPTPPVIDLKAITDEEVYERLHQSASLRELVVKELIRRGYTADLEALVANSPATTKNNPADRPSQSAGQMTPLPAEAPPYHDPDNPQVQLQLSPYRNTPSLAGLYSQFPQSREKLRRFGSGAFLVDSGNANQLPMDMPAGPDYVLGPGDALVVNMWGGRSTRINRIIDRQGQIALPEAGTIDINGMTITQAQSAIQKALDTQFQGEHVEISLGRLRTVRIYVVGDVQRPGAYDVSSLSTPLSALYAAGGPTSHGSLRILRHYRGKELVRQVDLYDFLLRGVRSTDDRLLSGDTILVPPIGAQVSIEGAVRRPAIYELNGEQGLNQVLDLAGGLLVSASLKQINIERIDAHQDRTMVRLELPSKPDEIKEQLAAFKVKDGDDVEISQILPYNEQAVYLEGHVFHPGKYPYRDGMTIGDLLHSYQDIMPEPADHAELVRLSPPDFRPVTTEFNLRDALIGNDPIQLRPSDLIRVYGRYEADAPSVTINGEVLRPGKYPMSNGMTAAELVRMAGGFRRSAFTEDVDVSSYVIENGQRVMVNHSNIDVQKVLDGDKSADLLLKSGDVVSIRSLTGWQDIGSTVTIAGEVEHAGSYGIRDGERLSSVLKRAGGFLPNAYPYAAILQRVQVRELNEEARQQMIRRIEETPVTVNPSATNGNATAGDIQKSLDAQRDQILATLRSHPAGGRLVINISSDISKWENTPADILLRAGDTLVIPKKPDFVMTNGQVYNPVAISYVPGKNLSWYFKKAGGATSSADQGKMYLLRADGSVVPRSRGWLGDNFMDLRMRPGDTIFVPEKIVGASQAWQNLAATAQILTAAMIPLALTGVL